MEVKNSSGKSNYFFTFIKLFLFLLIFSFLVSFSKEFYNQACALKDFNMDILFSSILSCLMFYIFIVDLNGVYKTIQNFFFHTSQISLFVPSLLILVGIAYFIVPKMFNVVFNRELFLFIGGFISTAHLIYASHETKGATFADLINYLFMISILYIITMFLFFLYLRTAYDIDAGKIAVEGTKEGAVLIKNLFTQMFQK